MPWRRLLMTGSKYARAAFLMYKARHNDASKSVFEVWKQGKWPLHEPDPLFSRPAECVSSVAAISRRFRLLYAPKEMPVTVSNVPCARNRSGTERLRVGGCVLRACQDVESMVESGLSEDVMSQHAHAATPVSHPRKHDRSRRPLVLAAQDHSKAFCHMWSLKPWQQQTSLFVRP
ncbi:hypothetical protein P171DRAFT_70114 [Karstenula rhodostoma CBS 690.94]|uniref:Uncharacterized protein n=1 Tax=Karstenula rhodostoma CBS 690.94 TaxID=1392251 RepID=A0A9P4PGK6_9PLEO|nr:hypothetical protein P171DRAFT_70114 [Karstenula rhodostoma CBS 690.94]